MLSRDDDVNLLDLFISVKLSLFQCYFCLVCRKTYKLEEMALGKLSVLKYPSCVSTAVLTTDFIKFSGLNYFL